MFIKHGETGYGDGEMPEEEHRLYKREDLSSDPWHPHKELGVTAGACVFSSGRQRPPLVR